MGLTKFNARIGDNLLEVVSSIEELQSLKHFNHPVLVLGAADIEDGDGGIYFWDGSNNEESDDISRIRSNGNDVGRWKRLSYALNTSVDAPLNFEAESSRAVSFQQGNHSFGVASRFNVRATSNVDWITIGNIDRDDLSHTLNYSVSQNLSSSSREGVITIKNGFNTFTYVVTQAEVEMVSGPTQLVYTNQAKSNNIATITSNASWSASASDNWITLTSSNGNGNGSIQFDLTENNNQFADRTGTITITTTSGYVSHVITIGQSQAASVINDVVDQSISADASNNQSFIVNSDIGWTATTNTDWITITTGTGDNGDSVVYSVTQNTDVDNDRTGTITLTSDNNTNVVTVNIIQRKLADAFSLRIDTTLVSNSNEFVISRARNITIDWGDGSPSRSTPDNFHFNTLRHTYATDGQYTVSITQNDKNNPATTINQATSSTNLTRNWYINSGKIINGDTFQSSVGSCDFSFNFVPNESLTQSTSQKMITEILSWGDLKIDSLERFMPYATNLTNVASDVDQFDTSSVAAMLNAFYQCNNLTSFPLIDTSSVADMQSAWYYCNSLTSFPSINTSSVTNMQSAWSNCRSLTSFPSINTSSVTNMHTAWSNCVSLTLFPSIDTSSVTNMYAAWNTCDSLTSFPSIDTSNVTNMSITWSLCVNLTEFPLIDTSSVTDMISTWSNCVNLRSFPLINTISVTNMQSAWSACSRLTSFPLINTSNVTNMQSAWYNCTSLTSFSSINTSNATNMSNTWYRCRSLTSFPSIDVSSNTNFTRTWYNCTALSSFTPFTNSTYASAEWDETWKGCDNLTFTSVSNSPFANIGANTLSVNTNFQTVVYRSPGESTYQNRGLYDPLPDGSTYYPPFDVSGVSAIYIDDSTTNITEFNIDGWDAMTFPRVNFGADPNPTVEIDINATLASTKVDDILIELYSNLSNHTPLEGTSTYSINFHSNVRTTASDTAYDGLIAAGWNITLNNVLQLGTAIQLGSDIDGEGIGDESGWSVSMNSTGDRIAIGARYNDGNGNAAGHVRIYEYSNETWSQLGSDIDGEAADDLSGSSVSLNAAGNRVAIGAINNDGNGTNSGHTRIYEYNGTNWTQLGSDIDGEASGDLSGSSVRLNAAGNRVAIGAINNDGNGPNSGHTRIYEYNGTNWTQLGSDIDGEASGDLSGSSVRLNAAGNRVAIGAEKNDGDNPQFVEQGHVRIYEYNGTNWTQLGSDIDGEGDYDRADTIALNAAGDRVALGSSGFDVGAPLNSNIGHVRIYEYSNGTWTQLGSDIVGDGEVDGIGRSLSFNAVGNRIIIGGAGHTRIYEYNGTNWTQLGQNIDDEGIGDESGWSVSMNDAGDKVAIGAPDNDGNGNNSGHTRIYEYNGTNWTQLGQDIDGEAEDDHSGSSVSLNAAGNRVAIGAYSNDDIGIRAGHTRIYQI